MKTFRDVFNGEPEAEARAPGRVNLLGEHTDYNDGYVLPTAIPQYTTVQVARNPSGKHRFYAAVLDEYLELAPDERPAEGYARYVYGCIRRLQESGHRIPPLQVHITSDVSLGAGLSSSAALEVAVLRALRSLLNLDLDDVRLALLAQQAEIQFTGVRCGIMDQMAASLADTEHMLFLDTRTLARRLLPLPAHAELVVIDSDIPRALSGSQYNMRRAECEEAARRLQVSALRDVTDPDAAEALPEPLKRRARHVITENHRVLEATQGVSARRFGELMNASHASLRDDYEVSTPPLDLLVSLLQGHGETYGARLTGAGFGGACVALVEAGSARLIAQAVIRRYQDAGHGGRVLIPEPGSAA
jgi:galactokinase